MNQPMPRGARRGFTIVELLVSVSIIGLIASAVLAGFSEFQKKGRNAKRNAEVAQYIRAIELYQSDRAEFPEAGTPTARSCLGDRSNDRCWSNDYYGEDAQLKSQLTPYIAQSGGVDGGLSGYDGYIYRCEYQVGGLCKGFSILWMVEGPNQSCGPGARINPAVNAGTATYCEYIQCGLERTPQTDGGDIYYCTP